MLPISFFHPYKYRAPVSLLFFLTTAPSLLAQWVPHNPVTSAEADFSLHTDDPKLITLPWRHSTLLAFFLKWITLLDP